MMAPTKLKYLHDVKVLPHLAAPYEPQRIRELRSLIAAKKTIIGLMQEELEDLEREFWMEADKYNDEVSRMMIDGV